ncbi:MAG: 4-hydroxy-tetrahydrodipicolinate synthase [Flavobacteriales bacterium]|nr:MAG: 4-hydroxy-tetrahydrodipicolinate synthase [Flavobacteriales bacterium]
MKALQGTGVALVTPFSKQGNIDISALKNIVRFQMDNGINYLVLLGTTAETATLTKAEKDTVIKTVSSVNNGKLPLVLGIGGNNTRQLIQEISERDLTPFSAILSVTPYYNKPSQEGLYQHYKAIAQISPVPVMLYNVPSRTGVNLLPRTTLQLASDFKNIIAIKEAVSNITQSMRLLQKKPKDFMVISGDDMLALPMVLAGGAGVISVIGQGMPAPFSKMIRLALNGEAKRASKIHYKMMDGIDYIFEEGNPAGIKFLLSHRGFCNPDLRLPLVSAGTEIRKKISKFVDNY